MTGEDVERPWEDEGEIELSFIKWIKCVTTKLSLLEAVRPVAVLRVPLVVVTAAVLEGA